MIKTSQYLDFWFHIGVPTSNNIKTNIKLIF